MIRIVPFLLLAALAGPVAAQENLAAAAPQFTVTADNPVPATTVVPVQRPAVQVGERTVIDDRSTRGMTREERRQEEEDHYTPQYSIVVQFTNGGSRGFLISADDKRQALVKLMDRLGEGNIACIDSIHIGFVYLDSDIIS